MLDWPTQDMRRRFVRLHHTVKEMVEKQALSGQRCDRLTQELTTRKQYHGELVNALWQGMELPGRAPPVHTSSPLHDFPYPNCLGPSPQSLTPGPLHIDTPDLFVNGQTDRKLWNAQLCEVVTQIC